MPKATKPNLTPYAVVGVAVILMFMWFYSRMTKPQTEKTGAETVTVENEFANPVKLPEPASEAEATARKKFTFSVTSPKNGDTVTTANIKVTGKTVASADVYVNEIDGKADKSGNFSIAYTLEEGENYLIIGVNDEFGNFNETEITVYYQN